MSNTRDTEKAVDEHIDGYVMEGDVGCYTPNDSERFMLKDAIAGLLANSAFRATLAPTAPVVPTSEALIDAYCDGFRCAARMADALAARGLTEDQARERFNEWYDAQPMPQLLARVDPQQAAHNAFEFGRSLA